MLVRCKRSMLRNSSFEDDVYWCFEESVFLTLRGGV